MTKATKVLPFWEAAENRGAWAIGSSRGEGHRFRVRRIVWGRALARVEKRPGETLRRADIMVTRNDLR